MLRNYKHSKTDNSWNKNISPSMYFAVSGHRYTELGVCLLHLRPQHTLH